VDRFFCPQGQKRGLGGAASAQSLIAVRATLIADVRGQLEFRERRTHTGRSLPPTKTGGDSRPGEDVKEGTGLDAFRRPKESREMNGSRKIRDSSVHGPIRSVKRGRPVRWGVYNWKWEIPIRNVINILLSTALRYVAELSKERRGWRAVL